MISQSKIRRDTSLTDAWAIVAEHDARSIIEFAERLVASRLQSLKAERDALASQVQRMEYSDGDAEHWKFLAERAEAENATLKGEVAALLNAYGRTVLAALEAKP
jgi:hypothetical protein